MCGVRAMTLQQRTREWRVLLNRLAWNNVRIVHGWQLQQSVAAYHLLMQFAQHSGMRTTDWLTQHELFSDAAFAMRDALMAHLLAEPMIRVLP